MRMKEHHLPLQPCESLMCFYLFLLHCTEEKAKLGLGCTELRVPVVLHHQANVDFAFYWVLNIEPNIVFKS